MYSSPSPLAIKIACWCVLPISLYCLLSVPANIRAAGQLDASPLCSVQDIPDCVREVKVTIVDTTKSKTTHTTVILPNGSDQRLHLIQSRSGFDMSLDAETLSQLIPGQEVAAHEWRGKIISLQTAWQTKISTSDDPHTGQFLYLVIGVMGTLIAGSKLWPDIAAFARK